MTNEETDERLKQIFEKSKNSSFSEIIKRCWVFCDNEKSCNTEVDILFVGINPSYIEGKERVSPYGLSGAVEAMPRHYGSFNQVAKELDKSWAYMDLFYFRESKQAEINKIFKDKKYGIEFIKEQLQLSFDILQKISPKVIAICNKQSHEFFGVNRKNNKHIWLGFQFQNTDNENVKTIIGMDSDFIASNEFKTEWNPKVVFSQSLSARYLSTIKKGEIMVALKGNIQYALSL